MDLFEHFGEFGAAGKGWRSPVAIAGAVLGAAIGGYLGHAAEGILGALGGIGSGALIGWFAGVMLRGVFFFAILFAVVLAVMFGWDWLTGAA